MYLCVNASGLGPVQPLHARPVGDDQHDLRSTLHAWLLGVVNQSLEVGACPQNPSKVNTLPPCSQQPHTAVFQSFTHQPHQKPQTAVFLTAAALSRTPCSSLSPSSPAKGYHTKQSFRFSKQPCYQQPHAAVFAKAALLTQSQKAVFPKQPC